MVAEPVESLRKLLSTSTNSVTTCRNKKVVWSWMF